MHNGAFVSLEEAIRYHLDAAGHAPAYTSDRLPADLRITRGPMSPVLERLEPRLHTPVVLSDAEFDALVDFVRDGLLDPAAKPAHLRRLIPERLPSGRAPFRFEFR